MVSIFSFLTSRLFRRPRDIDVAMIVAIRHVACPYCNSIYGVLALAPVRERVDTRMTVFDGRGEAPNPDFRNTHLANPVTCPVCGRNYRILAGVERRGLAGSIRSVHISVVKPDQPFVDEVSRWPHQGLVAREVLEYSPGRALLYDDLQHFEEYNKELGLDDIKAASLPSGVPQIHAAQEADLPRRPPQVIDLDKGRRRGMVLRSSAP